MPAETRSGNEGGGEGDELPPPRPVVSSDDPLAVEEALLRAELQAIARALPERIDVDPSKVEQGLARLVLTLIEMLRKVLEHQAVRRMDGGTLTEAEHFMLTHKAASEFSADDVFFDKK